MLPCLQRPSVGHLKREQTNKQASILMQSETFLLRPSSICKSHRTVTHLTLIKGLIY